MKASRLIVRGYRVIEALELEPSPSLNLVTGSNGSGKTSVLEALYAIAHSRSFGGGKFSGRIRDGEEFFSVFGEFFDSGDDGAGISAGVARSRNTVDARLNGSTVTALSQITCRLPMLAMCPKSCFQFDNSARVRRAALDWGLFHVEHEYQSVLSRYSRLLRQRNSLLKTGVFDQLAVWDEKLAHEATALDDFRTDYCLRWGGLLQDILLKLGLTKNVKIRYRRGWGDGQSLSGVLVRQRANDFSAGYTRYGPHVADISIVVDGRSAGDYCSAGQLKVLQIAMRLSQVELHFRALQRSSIIIIDDLLSELDADNASAVIGLLSDSDHQVFVSSVFEDQKLFGSSNWKVFHVEHGGLCD